MWQLLYIIAFAVLATLAITNLVRNLILLGGRARQGQAQQMPGGDLSQVQARPAPHPELLDQDGNMIREPLLVMRSISVKDARQQLDEIYNNEERRSDESGDAGLDD
jgi:hypothetical protein